MAKLKLYKGDVLKRIHGSEIQFIIIDEFLETYRLNDEDTFTAGSNLSVDGIHYTSIVTATKLKELGFKRAKPVDLPDQMRDAIERTLENFRRF